MHKRLRSLLALCLFCLLAALAAGIFWRPLTAELVHKSLQAYCHFCLQASFAAEKVIIENGTAVFVNPSFSEISDQPRFHGKADLISLSLISLQNHLALSLQIDAPWLEVTPSQKNSAPSSTWEPSRRVHLSIQNGTVAINTPAKEKDCRFAFSGQGCREQFTLTLQSQEGGLLECHYEDRDWELQFSDFNLSQAHQALTTLGLNFLPADVNQGKLQGRISVDWDDEDLPDIQGNLGIRDCVFSNKTGDMHGYIPEASFLLNDSSLSGKLSLNKGAYLEYSQEGKPPISLSELEGTLSLPTYDQCVIQATGLCKHHGSTFELAIGGNIHARAQGRASCELEITLLNQKMQPIRACISSSRESFDHSQCMLDVQNIGADEWDLLMLALGTQDIGLEPYTLSGGLIDARIKLELEHLKVKKIHIEEFLARQVAFELDQSNVSVHIEHAHGNLSLDVSGPKVLETLQASFGIDGGEVQFPALNKQLWQLSNLRTELSVEDGTLKKSFVEADFLGLKGMIEVDWASKKAMKIQFQGDVHGLAALAPSNVQKGLLRKFEGDTLAIQADVWKISSGLSVEGFVEAIGERASEQIQIGFLLEKATGNNLLGPSAVLFTKRLGADIIQALVNKIAKPPSEPTAEWLKEELLIAGLALKNGWFSASGLPTEKYIEPFFFKDGQMAVSGAADFVGRFDCDGLAVEYHSPGIILENDDLCLELGEISSSQPARHYFDFHKDADQGSVPVSNGTYFEKNSGLLYSNVAGIMILKDKAIHIPAIKTACNSVSFFGSIDVDYSSPEKRVFDVSMKINSMEGSYANVQDLLSHFQQTVGFAELPMEGKIFLKDSCNTLFFGFRPSGCHVQANIQGCLEEGILHTPLSEVCMRKIRCDFNYDHEAKHLKIAHLRGDICHNEEEHPLFRINGAHVDFLGQKDEFVKFDIPLLNSRSAEILRLAGSAEKSYSFANDSLAQITLNKERSHCAGSPPDKCTVSLDAEHNIESVDALWECNLEDIFPDLHKIAAIALETYQPALAKKWQALPSPSGRITAKVQYDNPGRQLQLHVDGYEIRFGETAYAHLVFAGGKKRNLWSVEQLQVDGLSLATDILPQPDGYKINFLGLRYNNMLLLGLEGFYNLSQAAFSGNVNLFDVNFAHLGQWPLFAELVDDYHPQGLMKGSGNLSIVMTDQWPPHAEINLNAALRGCSLRDLHFENADNVSCKFIYNDKLLLTGCNSGLRCNHTGATQGLFGVEKVLYDFKKEELALQGMHFHAHAENLDWIASKLQQTFPEAVSPDVANIVRHIKESEALRGSIDLRINDDEAKVAIRLPQGIYKIGTKDHEVNNFVLEWDKKMLQIVTQYRFQDTLYWISAQSSVPELIAGDILVSAYPPSHPKHANPNEHLCISWYMHPQYGMIVEKALGNLPGISVDLARDRQYPMNPHSWHLDGRIILNPMTGQHILPPDIIQALASWNIANDYILAGKWIFMLSQPHEGEIYFQGQLHGQDVILKGFYVGRISAELDCSPQQINIQSLKVQDSAGSLQVDSASMVKQSNGDWWVYIPKVVGENFRPCLLREIDEPPAPHKPLIIPRFEVNNIVCRADDLSTMTGSGKLTFNNSSKRPTHNPLLAIPAEIISRIGLNLDVLDPVRGDIFFEIEDYKVKMKKFKDVYSEGKLSKFYLPDSNYPSYVDLDGNVHVQVRMKQYNLLFKFAELFTVTIRGTLQKPIYTLQKQ